jgi:rRNA-processing protein FCF1
MASDRLRRDSDKIVVIDTSAIISFFEYSISFEKELTRLLGLYSIVIPSTVINELTKLTEKGKGKKRTNAKAALKLIENYRVVNIKGESVDDSVIDLAEKNNGIVFSNDKEIRRKSKAKGIKTIILRNKKYLALEGSFV